MGKSEAEMSSKSDKVSSSSKAYYGFGVPLLAPHFNSAVLGGHFPYPFVWAPSQPLIPPYGVPYTAIHSHRVHAHPAVPLVATPLSEKVHSKASMDMDQGFTKKFKRLDGLAVPVGNGSTEDVAGGSVCELSQSVKHDVDGSTDGSDENTGDKQQLKRERRKQANRESAKRSRLRKQTENEELISRYETLNEENKALKFEISNLTEHLNKVRQENTALQEKLKNKRQLGLQGEIASSSCKNDAVLTLPNKLEEVDKPNDSQNVRSRRT